MCWNLNPSVMVSGGRSFGRWLSHEDGALTNGVSALIKENPDSSHLFCCVRSEQKEPGSGCWPDTKSAGALILDSPDYKALRNKCLLFKPPSPWYVCQSSWTSLSHAWSPQAGHRVRPARCLYTSGLPWLPQLKTLFLVLNQSPREQFYPFGMV